MRSSVTRAPTALLLVVGSIFATLMLLEGGLRLVGYSATPVVEPDPVRGWSLAANVPNMTNSLGLRDRERTVANPNASFRIAILGDSMAEAVQVGRAETFPAVLETALNRQGCFGARPIEVLNFAVQGYGTAQQYLTLSHQVWPFAPDVVVLAFFPGNDVRDNSHLLKGSVYLPFYTLESGQLKLDASFGNQWSYRVRTFGAKLIRHSRLAQLANQIRFNLKARLRAHTDRGVTEAAGLGEVGVDNLVFVPSPPPEWEAAWQVTEALISQMNLDARLRGVPFHLAILGTAGETHPDPAVASALAADINVSDLTYPRRRIASLGNSRGFPVVDLVTPLAQQAAEQNLCLHGEPGGAPCTGHYTAAGHKAVAAHLAAHLCGAEKVPAN